MSIEVVGFRFISAASERKLQHLFFMGKISGKMMDEEVAQIGKALGDQNRLAIYTQIAGCNELFCGEMHAKRTISAPTLSHHLKVLTDLGLITHRKEGLNVYYRAVPERFTSYLKYLSGIGKARE